MPNKNNHHNVNDQLNEKSLNPNDMFAHVLVQPSIEDTPNNYAIKRWSDLEWCGLGCVQERKWYTILFTNGRQSSCCHSLCTRTRVYDSNRLDVQRLRATNINIHTFQLCVCVWSVLVRMCRSSAGSDLIISQCQQLLQQ